MSAGQPFITSPGSAVPPRRLFSMFSIACCSKIHRLGSDSAQEATKTRQRYSDRSMRGWLLDRLGTTTLRIKSAMSSLHLAALSRVAPKVLSGAGLDDDHQP